MSTRYLAQKQADLVCSIRTQNIEPITVALPLTQQSMNLSIQNIKQSETCKTFTKLRQIEHSISIKVFLKGIFLLILGIVIFYLLVIIVAITLFNPVLTVIFLILMAKYMKFAYETLCEQQANINLNLMKIFLKKQNKRFYSRKLLRFQLDQTEFCIKILNLRFLIE